MARTSIRAVFKWFAFMHRLRMSLTEASAFAARSSRSPPAFLRVLTARAAQGFAMELTGAFETIPVVTGDEPIIPRLVFTRLVLISAHTKKIDANKHMTANKPV